MTVPFLKYVAVKDNYCLSYFGSDKDMVKELIHARESIERELPGVKLYICLSENLYREFYGKRNMLNELQLKDNQGRFTYYRNLEKKEDLKFILDESKIPH